LRIIVRRQWLAIAGITLLFGVLSILRPIGPLDWIVATLYVLYFGVGFFLLLRFGLVAGCLYFFSDILQAYPVTSNFSAWYATSGLFAVGVLLVLAGFACYASMGGQKLFAGKLLEE
jgi:hypothetical protein